MLQAGWLPVPVSYVRSQDVCLSEVCVRRNLGGMGVSLAMVGMKVCRGRLTCVKRRLVGCTSPISVSSSCSEGPLFRQEAEFLDVLETSQ